MESVPAEFQKKFRRIPQNQNSIIPKDLRIPQVLVFFVFFTTGYLIILLATSKTNIIISAFFMIESRLLQIFH